MNDSKDDVQLVLEASWVGSSSEEVSVVGRNMVIVASSNKTLQDRSAAAVLDADVLAQAMNGNSAESQKEVNSINVLSMSFPVESEEGNISGAVFVRADLSSIDSFLTNSRLIFLRAMILALLITVVLGFILASSITVPIKDVTRNVQRMSQGDFSEDVSVKSGDEIGQLAEMFNILRAKLDSTLEEISQEKNKLGTILQFMADGLVAIDMNGNVLHINPAAKEMLEIMPHEIPAGALPAHSTLPCRILPVKLSMYPEPHRAGPRLARNRDSLGLRIVRPVMPWKTETAPKALLKNPIERPTAAHRRTRDSQCPRIRKVNLPVVF